MQTWLVSVTRESPAGSSVATTTGDGDGDGAEELEPAVGVSRLQAATPSTKRDEMNVFTPPLYAVLVTMQAPDLPLAGCDVRKLAPHAPDGYSTSHP